MTQLAVFGDSWPYGAELKKDEKTFGELLHDKLKTKKFINCSQEGTSIDHLVLQLKNFIENLDQKSIAVFFITNPIRYITFENNKWHTIRPTGEKSTKTKLYYELLQSDELDHHRANTSMLALQNMCKNCANIVQDVYLEGWTKIDWSYPGIDTKKILRKSALQMFEAKMNHRTNELVKNQNNPFIYPNKYHPNQKGHQLIADELYEFIK